MREKENRQFRILSALGIIFVVAGHLGYGLFDVGGLFPCYSFHVFIFLFVSGYFYREDAESDILGYVRRKCFTLLLPYFLWNLFYGILARIISGHPFFSEKLAAIGRGTYSVMMHHAAVFMLVKGVFYLCSRRTSFCAGFDSELFFHDINYVYSVGGTEAGKWIYLLAGIGVPLLADRALRGAWRRLNKNGGGFFTKRVQKEVQNGYKSTDV